MAAGVGRPEHARQPRLDSTLPTPNQPAEVSAEIVSLLSKSWRRFFGVCGLRKMPKGVLEPRAQKEKKRKCLRRSQSQQPSGGWTASVHQSNQTKTLGSLLWLSGVARTIRRGPGRRPPPGGRPRTPRARTASPRSTARSGRRPDSSCHNTNRVRFQPPLQFIDQPIGSSLWSIR